MTATPSAELPDAHDVAATRRAIRLASILVLLLAISGVVAVHMIDRQMLGRNGLFYAQFAAMEPLGLVILAAFTVAILYLLRSRPTSGGPFEMAPAWLNDSIRTRAAMALAVLIVTITGTHVVFHNYPFVSDEYSNWFQGVIYSHGSQTATLPPEWCPWITNLRPLSIDIVRPCTWRVAYGPIHGLIRGAFIALRQDAFAEPVLATLCVVLVVMIARRAWPDRPDRAVLSGLLLAASTQFLVMTMTPFSMTAHLFFSFLWLWVYVHPKRMALIVLPWIGVLAMGVHSPAPHVLFVAPFFVRFLLQRRFVALFYLSVVYGLGLLFWLGNIVPGRVVASYSVTNPDQVPAVARYIGSLGTLNGLSTSMSLSLLGTWNVPLALVCVLVALLLWSRLDGFARWLALSLLFTVGARAVFFHDQGAGWGNRYAFAALGNFVILAAIGAEFIAEGLGRRRTYSLLAVALIVAVTIQLPLRGFQAERIVRPYYLASDWMARYPADVLIFDPSLVWLGFQLVRNDPFLRNTPKILGFSRGGNVIDSVAANRLGRVHVVTFEELRQFGLKW